ncbi:MAG: Manganese ABC transporter, ATP-binding protein SitB, partial [uncultured Rubrobacteraceae bacterium]
ERPPPPIRAPAARRGRPGGAGARGAVRQRRVCGCCGARAAGGEPAGAGRGQGRACGAQRLGEVHATQGGGRVAAGGLRGDCGLRKPRRGVPPQGRLPAAARGDRLAVPDQRPEARDDGPLRPPRLAQASRPQGPRGRLRGDGGPRPLPPCGAPDRGALRRPAAARPPRQGARSGRGPAPPGRAPERRGRRHPRDHLKRPLPAATQGQDHARRHPRPREPRLGVRRRALPQGGTRGAARARRLRRAPGRGGGCVGRL